MAEAEKEKKERAKPTPKTSEDYDRELQALTEKIQKIKKKKAEQQSKERFKSYNEFIQALLPTNIDLFKAEYTTLQTEFEAIKQRHKFLNSIMPHEFYKLNSEEIDKLMMYVFRDKTVTNAINDIIQHIKSTNDVVNTTNEDDIKKESEN